MLPLPKLDDRSYDEIRDEAIRNIVRHCPDWTNHNASDPGITLIELFASMSEMLMYRLNRVPNKNYLAFLDMLGITGRLATPAKTRIAFKLSDGYELGEAVKSTVKINKNITIATDDDEPILFETENETKISNVKLNNLFSKVYDNDKKEHLLVEHFKDFETGKGFIPFEVSEKSTNNAMVYLYSDSLASLKDRSLVSVLFRIPTAIDGFSYESEKSFLKRLDWEYYTGEAWKSLSIANSDLDLSNFDTSDANILSVTFDGNCESFRKSTLEDIVAGEHYFIRATLRESKRWLNNFEVYEMSIASKSRVEGVIPEACNYRQLPLDLNNDFYPFGNRPKNDENIKDAEYFYIKSKEAFSKRGAKVVLTMKHSQNRDYEMPRAYNDLKLSWHYYNDTDEWKRLEVNDSTNNFTANGTVEFTVPKDMAAVKIHGEPDYWIQCRIDAGHYGEEEKRELINGEEKIISAHTLNPPKFSRIVIAYNLAREDIESCNVYNNYTYNHKAFSRNQPEKLFDQEQSKEQSFNICFDSFISEDYLDLYFEVDESVVEKRNLKSNERILEWQVLINESWKQIEIVDGTDELTRSGDIRLQLPKQDKLSKIHLNGEDSNGMWVKAKVKSNALTKIPTIKNIRTNSVLAVQKESFTNEFMGKSIGLPEMSFTLNHKNIVQAPKIFVGDEEYTHVKRFIEQGKEDKVFRFYGITGEVKFGDGKYGEIPKPNEDIYAKEYAVTLGKKGNVDTNRVVNLRQSISFVESVSNIIPATGGADGDDLDDLKKYAPSEFKTRDRAITAEDYESLTKEFSSNIINAKASSQEGDIYIVVVTQDIIEEEGFINRKLIQDLEEYLKSKSLITVQPFVKSPNIVPVSISVKIKTTTSQNEVTRDDLEKKLEAEAKKYFSLTKGGDKQDGYPMGKNITRADLYKLLNRVDSTLYFDKITMNDAGEKVVLNYDDIVKFENFSVEELSYDA